MILNARWPIELPQLTSIAPERTGFARGLVGFSGLHADHCLDRLLTLIVGSPQHPVHLCRQNRSIQELTRSSPTEVKL